jgi:hypothetical protein
LAISPARSPRMIQAMIPMSTSDSVSLETRLAQREVRL